MSIMKDMFIEAYEDLCADAEENGEEINEDKICERAHKLSVERFADMCDAAKDRAKYEKL